MPILSMPILMLRLGKAGRAGFCRFEDQEDSILHNHEVAAAGANEDIKVSW